MHRHYVEPDYVPVQHHHFHTAPGHQLVPNGHVLGGGNRPAVPGSATTRHVLAYYAQAIREHASGVSTITGLSGRAVDKYKRNCFDAARMLDENVELLTTHDESDPVVLTDPAKQGLFTRVLNAIFGPAVCVALGLGAGTAWNYFVAGG